MNSWADFKAGFIIDIFGGLNKNGNENRVLMLINLDKQRDKFMCEPACLQLIQTNICIMSVY